LKKQVKLRVFGRVQGVNFRVNVKAKADELGLVGRVWNCDDGSVEIIACGDERDLRELIEWVKSSPGFSKVNEVKEEWQEAKEKFDSFGVIRDGNFVRDKLKSVGNLSKRLFK